LKRRARISRLINRMSGFAVANGSGRSSIRIRAAGLAAPIFGQQCAPRWWLIRPSEAGTYCKIVIIWQSSSPNLGRVGRLDTAPQFCGLKHDHEQFSSGKMQEAVSPEGGGRNRRGERSREPPDLADR
jgi:hypothetical protein